MIVCLNAMKEATTLNYLIYLTSWRDTLLKTGAIFLVSHVHLASNTNFKNFQHAVKRVLRGNEIIRN